MVRLLIGGAMALCLMLPASVHAVCEDTNFQTVEVGVGRWRTLTGSDSTWSNDYFDGNSGEPTFPRTQEVGFLSGTNTFNTSILATIQDSSDTECDNVEIRGETAWFTSSASCSGTREGSETYSYFVNTCMFTGNARFFGQRSPTLFGLSFRPSYGNNVTVWRNGVLARYESAFKWQSCFRVSAAQTGCN
jgi:hypothetical protein